MDSIRTPGGLHQGSMDFVRSISGLHQEFTWSIRTPDGVHQDAWGSVTYRKFTIFSTTSESKPTTSPLALRASQLSFYSPPQTWRIKLKPCLPIQAHGT